MKTRAARVVLFALLLLVGIGAGVLTWSLARRAGTLDTAERDVTARIDELIDRLSVTSHAQTAYVAPGQPAETWMERVTAGLAQISADSEALRARTRSVEAAPRLQALADGVARFAQSDAAVRDDVHGGRIVAATERIFTDGQPAIQAMQMSMRHLRTAESVAFLMEREALVQQASIALGSVALLWVVGLAVLIRVPPPHPVVTPAPPPVALPRAEPPIAAVDLTAASELCTAISRLSSTTELPDLLARTADLLDAQGVIVWMGAGDELFAARAHGYDPRVINRLGSIARSADNATAAAWRSGEIRTVAGDAMANGAIVAPMFGPDACIGVLAAEVRHGREHDPATRAVTAMVAAQLATAVAAWPAASPHAASII